MLTARAAHRQIVNLESVSIFLILTITFGIAFRKFVVIWPEPVYASGFSSPVN